MPSPQAQIGATDRRISAENEYLTGVLVLYLTIRVIDNRNSEFLPTRGMLRPKIERSPPTFGGFRPNALHLTKASVLEWGENLIIRLIFRPQWEK